jgi:hypothetical protein
MRDRPCGKKDAIAFRIQKTTTYRGGGDSWQETYTFCKDHAPGRENVSTWTQSNTSRIWSSINVSILEQVPVPDIKMTKKERNKESVKYQFKRIFKTKYVIGISVEEMAEILVDAHNEHIVESVNNQ